MRFFKLLEKYLKKQYFITKLFGNAVKIMFLKKINFFYWNLI
jgi:hypothetical protein